MYTPLQYNNLDVIRLVLKLMLMLMLCGLLFANRYRGHSAAVTSVRIAPTDNFIASVRMDVVCIFRVHVSVEKGRMLTLV